VSPSDTSNDAIVQRLAPNSMMTNASTKTHSTNQACKEMMKRKNHERMCNECNEATLTKMNGGRITYCKYFK
jgi:hypothetical protein